MMLTRATAVTLALVIAATLGFGGVAPQPAEASDTGKVLAGLAAGAIVYGILDSADRDHRDNRRYDRNDRYSDRYSDRDSNRRGYYDGNRNSYSQDRRYRDTRQFDRHEKYRQQQSNRRVYNRGYDKGYDNGYGDGWGDGYDYGRSRTRSGWCY